MAILYNLWFSDVQLSYSIMSRLFFFLGDLNQNLLFQGEKTGFFMHLPPSLKFTKVWYTAKIVPGHISGRRFGRASNAGLERTGLPSLIVAQRIGSTKGLLTMKPFLLRSYFIQKCRRHRNVSARIENVARHYV